MVIFLKIVAVIAVFLVTAIFSNQIIKYHLTSADKLSIGGWGIGLIMTSPIYISAVLVWLLFIRKKQKPVQIAQSQIYSKPPSKPPLKITEHFSAEAKEVIQPALQDTLSTETTLIPNEKLVSELSGSSDRELQSAWDIGRLIDTSDDSYYEQAFLELENNQKHIGTWAKVFSAANGDEKQAKVLYLKVRSEVLKQEAVLDEQIEEAKRLEAEIIDADNKAMKKSQNVPQGFYQGTNAPGSKAYYIKSWAVLIIFLIVFFALVTG